MIGTILGIISAVIWTVFQGKYLVPKEQKEQYKSISYGDISKHHSEYKLKARLLYAFYFTWAFVQFFIFLLWIFFILDQIRPNITEDFEANLVGFLFFQTMILNIGFGMAVYGYFFKIFGITTRTSGTDVLIKLNLDKYLHQFYVIGDEVQKKSLRMIFIVFIYYTVVNIILLSVWS